MTTTRFAVALAVGLVVALAAVQVRPRPSPRLLGALRSADDPPRRRGPLRRSTRHAVAVAVAVATFTAAAFVLGLVAAAVGTLVFVVVAAANGRRARRRHRLQIDRSLPDAVELFVLILHAGATPVQAVREVAELAPPPIQPAIRAVIHRLDRGQRLADALDELPHRLGPGARPVADGIASADRDGLPLAPVLERLAADIRSTRRRIAEADARMLSVRLSFPLVCCTLPAFVLLGIVPVAAGALSSISSGNFR